MFRNVLVGYDGSERGDDALALGLVLAGAEGVVTAACTYWWQPLSARVDKRRPGEMQLRAGAEKTLAQLNDRPGAVLRTVPAPGASPARALLDLVADRDYDLLVVGSTHRGRLGRVFAGTTADALLHGAPCAVAVAPLGYREHRGGLRRIGVAFDGSEPAQAALSTAHRVAAELGAELVVLSVFSGIPVLAAGDLGYGFAVEEPELRAAAQEGLDEAVAGLGDGVAVSGELLEGDAGAALTERSAGLDLLIMGSKGHNALGRVLLGSVSHHLMCNSSAPVLVVPPQ